MSKPYIIRREKILNDNPRVSLWVYLKNSYCQTKRFKTKESAEKELNKLNKEENWQISCCGVEIPRL